MIHYTTIETPIGLLGLARSDRGLCRILFEKDIPSMEEILQENYPLEPVVKNSESLKEARQQLQAYFQGKRKQCTLALDLVVPPFYRKVLDEVAKIPYGHVSSYHEIADRVGNPKAVRAVGSANARNPLPLVIPCHRVVSRRGGLGGYGGGLEIKHHLLRLEGAL